MGTVAVYGVGMWAGFFATFCGIDLFLEWWAGRWAASFSRLRGLCLALTVGWLVLAALSGCGSSTPELDGADPVEPALLLSPEPALLAHVELAAERWSRATGREVQIGDGGLPVRLVPQVINPNTGKLAWGVVWVSGTGVRLSMEIAANSPSIDDSVAHEVGHALGATAHPHTGIMAVKSEQQPWIDVASLEAVCGTLECVTMSPER